jgi:integrase
MGTLLRQSYTVALPPDADIIERSGRKCVRITTGGQTQTFPLTRDGTRYRRQSEKWYGQFTDGTGTVRRVALSADKAAAKQMLAKLERRAERQRTGLLDPAEDHAQRPLTAHLADYVSVLRGKGDSDAHITMTRDRIAAILDGCGFTFARDADVSIVAQWLTDRRTDKAPIELPAGIESFTPGETVRLFGISGAAIRATVKRLELEAVGHGKRRVYPRATVEAIAAARTRGIGPETANHYIRAVRGFFRWLVKAKRIGSNPLDTLSLASVACDVRRARRELTADELRRLLDATRQSGRTFRGLTGPDRYYLYLAAIGTGFRASALASLRPADFDLDLDGGTVTLAARNAKNKRAKVQPLPADVAEELRPYLATREPGRPIWGGTWARDKRGAEMLRGDLATAGIPYAVETPDGPLYSDFHALRHSFLTLGGRSGIDLRTLQILAGHSRPELTARYTHRRLDDLKAEIGKLPNLIPGSAKSLTPILTLTGCIPSQSTAPICTIGHDLPEMTEAEKTLILQGKFADLHSISPRCTSEGDGTRTRNHRIDSPVL